MSTQTQEKVNTRKNTHIHFRISAADKERAIQLQEENDFETLTDYILDRILGVDVNTNKSHVNTNKNHVNTTQEPFKKAFTSLYGFFKDVMSKINIIVPSTQGKKLWNTLLQADNRDLTEISEKGRLVYNT